MNKEDRESAGVVSTDVDTALAECEEIIGRGLDTFIEVGEALCRIHDEQLYRASAYTSFDTYCREQWDLGRSRAYQLMDASEIVRELPEGTPVPANEAQARELKLVEPEARAEVMKHAARGGKPTAPGIKKARESRKRTAAPRAPTAPQGRDPEHAPGPQSDWRREHRDAWDALDSLAARASQQGVATKDGRDAVWSGLWANGYPGGKAMPSAIKDALKKAQEKAREERRGTATVTTPADVVAEPVSDVADDAEPSSPVRSVGYLLGHHAVPAAFVAGWDAAVAYHSAQS